MPSVQQTGSDDDKERLRAALLKAWVEARLAEAPEMTPEHWDRLAEMLREEEEAD